MQLQAFSLRNELCYQFYWFLIYKAILPKSKVPQHGSEEECHLKPICMKTLKREQPLQYYCVYLLYNEPKFGMKL